VPATAIATDGAILAAQAAFPPFETATFPSQLFWFAISFGVLVVALVLRPHGLLGRPSHA
jgi:F-type H+-transporting ATPase subunit b